MTCLAVAGDDRHVCIAYNSMLIKQYRMLDDDGEMTDEKCTNTEDKTESVTSVVRSWRAQHKLFVICMAFCDSDANLLATGE